MLESSKLRIESVNKILSMFFNFIIQFYDRRTDGWTDGPTKQTDGRTDIYTEPMTTAFVSAY